MLKIAASIVIVLVLLGGAAGLVVTSTPLGERLRGMKREPEPTRVRVESVTVGSLVRTVNAPGAVQPRVQVQISAKVSSRILDLPFREGQEVALNDEIAVLDPEELTARLSSARAQLRATEASLRGDEARLAGVRASLSAVTREYARQRELADTGDIARSVLEQTEANYLRVVSDVAQLEAGIEASRAQIAIAEAQIEEAEKNLANTVVLAPMAGTITDLRVEVGEVVLGTRDNLGTVLMVIADRTQMIVRAQVDESNIAQVSQGQRVRVHINAYPDRQYWGVVERIDLTRQVAQGGTGFFQTEISLEMAPGERLLTGLTANVDIEVQTFEDVLRVPSQCVLDRRIDELPEDIAASPLIDRNKTFCRIVYRIVDGKAVATPVTIGASDLTHTAVLAGLSEGDRVVSGPYRVLITLKHGDAVRPEGESAAGEAGGDSGSPEPAPGIGAEQD